MHVHVCKLNSREREKEGKDSKTKFGLERKIFGAVRLWSCIFIDFFFLELANIDLLPLRNLHIIIIIIGIFIPLAIWAWISYDWPSFIDWVVHIVCSHSFHLLNYFKCVMYPPTYKSFCPLVCIDMQWTVIIQNTGLQFLCIFLLMRYILLSCLSPTII